jgi:hypothetical protein
MPGSADLYGSVDSGNNLNWFEGFFNAIPAPTLGLIGMMLLVLLIALTGSSRARHGRLPN